MSVLNVLLLTENGKAPTKATENSAGFDLYSAEEKNIYAGERAVISTDIAIKLPTGCYARIAPRSELAINFGIDIGGGVIDADYRGDVKIIVINNGKKDFKVKVGDRIGLLILKVICEAQIQVVETLNPTERGEVGSSGIRDNPRKMTSTIIKKN